MAKMEWGIRAQSHITINTYLREPQRITSILLSITIPQRNNALHLFANDIARHVSGVHYTVGSADNVWRFLLSLFFEWRHLLGRYDYLEYTLIFMYWINSTVDAHLRRSSGAMATPIFYLLFVLNRAVGAILSHLKEYNT